MKFCSHCGKELVDEAVVCPQCGCAAADFRPEQKETTYSALSIVGFVFAFVASVVGLVCSIIAYKNASEENNAKSKSLSKAGIITSAVFMGVRIFNIIFMTVLIILSFSGPTELYPGYYY